MQVCVWGVWMCVVIKVMWVVGIQGDQLGTPFGVYTGLCLHWTDHVCLSCSRSKWSFIQASGGGCYTRLALGGVVHNCVGCWVAQGLQSELNNLIIKCFRMATPMDTHDWNLCFICQRVTNEVTMNPSSSVRLKNRPDKLRATYQEVVDNIFELETLHELPSFVVMPDVIRWHEWPLPVKVIPKFY